MRTRLLIVLVLASCGSEGVERTYSRGCELAPTPATRACDAPQPADTQGLPECSVLGVQIDQRCTGTGLVCYETTTCTDGRVWPSNFVSCMDVDDFDECPKSSRRYKRDIEYLSAADRAALARQIEGLALARYRYTDQDDPDLRLGFIIEDAPAAPFYTSGKRRVDLYALLAATIATVQEQDAKIRELERRLDQRVATSPPWSCSP